MGTVLILNTTFAKVLFYKKLSRSSEENRVLNTWLFCDNIDTLMKYKVCDKCGEIVTRTGIISTSLASSEENSYFSQCNNRECAKRFSKTKFEKLDEKEF